MSGSHVAESQMRLGNSWVGILKSVVATGNFCIEYRGQGRWLGTVQSDGKRHESLRTLRGAKEKLNSFVSSQKSGRPISQWWPNGSTTRPMRHSCSSVTG